MFTLDKIVSQRIGNYLLINFVMNSLPDQKPMFLSSVHQEEYQDYLFTVGQMAKIKCLYDDCY